MCKNGNSGTAYRCRRCRNEYTRTNPKAVAAKRDYKREKRATDPEYRRRESEYRYKYEYNRLKTDPAFKLLKDVRTRFCHALKRKNWQKTSSLTSNIGCSPDDLKSHLERLFKPGMTWNNRGDWHIDHIVPLSSAKTEEEMVKLNHFSNLQPLWAAENIRKSNKN